MNAILKREINAVTRKRAVHEKVAAFAILKVRTQTWLFHYC